MHVFDEHVVVCKRLGSICRHRLPFRPLDLVLASPKRAQQNIFSNVSCKPCLLPAVVRNVRHDVFPTKNAKHLFRDRLSVSCLRVCDFSHDSRPVLNSIVPVGLVRGGRRTPISSYRKRADLPFVGVHDRPAELASDLALRNLL